MGMISVTTKGDWSKTYNMLSRLERTEFIDDILNDCGRMGVEALYAATPKRTGLTASSWIYEIEKNSKTTTIVWRNTNLTKDGDPIAILLQYGHGTGRGGYVAGRDYINPAMKPVFDDISEIVAEALIDVVRS